MVIVDTREPKLADILREKGVPCVVSTMSAGDVLVVETEPKVLIERKTWGDFAYSYISGRLHAQLTKMLSTDVDVKALVLEGNPGRLFYRSKISVSSIAGFVASVSLKYKLQILPTPSTVGTAYLIKSILNLLDPERAPTAVNIKLKPKGKDLWEEQLGMLMAVQGIGLAKATKLLEAHKTVKSVLDNTHSLNEILGHSLADHFAKVVTSEWKSSSAKNSRYSQSLTDQNGKKSSSLGAETTGLGS